MERWNHRPVLERSWSEQYLERRISVALRLDSTSGSIYARFCSDNDIAGRHKPERFDMFKSEPHGNVLELDFSQDRNNPKVLVQNIQIMQIVKGIVPASVWFDLVDDGGDHSPRRQLYRSTVTGRFQFLSGMAERECSVSGGFSTRTANDFNVDKVKAGSQVMDRITDKRSGPPGNLFRRSESIEVSKLLSGLRIFLSANSISVLLDKNGEHLVQLGDVLIGPFDL